MTKRQLVKWLEAKQSDAKAEVEIQYASSATVTRMGSRKSAVFTDRRVTYDTGRTY